MRPPDMPRAGRVPLLFQEQIQGAKNASIARFDGLGCYQSRSEISGFPERLSGVIFRTCLPAGMRPASGQTSGHCKPGLAHRKRWAAPASPAPLCQRRRARMKTPRQNAHAKTPPGRGGSGGVCFGFCSCFRSKFRGPKTPLSHGLTGLAAIKAGAKKRRFAGCRLASALAVCASWRTAAPAPRRRPTGATSATGPSRRRKG